MDYKLLLKCLLIGISSSCAIGPVFILTFNRGALQGFGKGCASALGASCADAIYFCLGLLGSLTLIENSKNISLLMDFFGGVILFIIGFKMLNQHAKGSREAFNLMETTPTVIAKSFLLTISNPFVAIFFMVISIQVIPQGLVRLPGATIVASSLMVMLGSFSMLSLIAFLASYIGKSVGKEWLNTIAYGTGILFVLGGLYFLADLIFNLVKIYGICLF